LEDWSNYYCKIFYSAFLKVWLSRKSVKIIIPHCISSCPPPKKNERKESIINFNCWILCNMLQKLQYVGSMMSCGI
jgi:hypothetical protein